MFMYSRYALKLLAWDLLDAIIYGLWMLLSWDGRFTYPLERYVWSIAVRHGHNAPEEPELF